MEPKYPPLTPGVLRIRQSKKETYLRCGLRYRFEEEEKTRFATVRMITGSAVAAGAREDNHAKIVGPGLKIGEILEATADGYEAELEESQVEESKLEVEAGKDHAISAARVYALQVSPLTSNVIEAETPIVASVHGIELAGTPDVITTEGVGDYKTGLPWTHDRADRSRQLSDYGLLHFAHLGHYPSRVWIDSLSKTKKGWRAERFWSSRTAEDYRAELEVIDRTVRAIQAGNDLPAPEASWWCSKAWCPFWKRCPAVAGRKG